MPLPFAIKAAAVGLGGAKVGGLVGRRRNTSAKGYVPKQGKAISKKKLAMGQPEIIKQKKIDYLNNTKRRKMESGMSAQEAFLSTKRHGQNRGILDENGRLCMARPGGVLGASGHNEAYLNRRKNETIAGHQSALAGKQSALESKQNALTGKAEVLDNKVTLLTDKARYRDGKAELQRQLDAKMPPPKPETTRYSKAAEDMKKRFENGYDKLVEPKVVPLAENKPVQYEASRHFTEEEGEEPKKKSI